MYTRTHSSLLIYTVSLLLFNIYSFPPSFLSLSLSSLSLSLSLSPSLSLSLSLYIYIYIYMNIYIFDNMFMRLPAQSNNQMSFKKFCLVYCGHFIHNLVILMQSFKTKTQRQTSRSKSKSIF